MDAASANRVSHCSSTAKVVMLNYTEAQEGVGEAGEHRLFRRAETASLPAFRLLWFLTPRDASEDLPSGEWQRGGVRGKWGRKEEAGKKKHLHTLWITNQRVNNDSIITFYLENTSATSTSPSLVMFVTLVQSQVRVTITWMEIKSCRNVLSNHVMETTAFSNPARSQEDKSKWVWWFSNVPPKPESVSFLNVTNWDSDIVSWWAALQAHSVKVLGLIPRLDWAIFCVVFTGSKNIHV